MIESVKPKLKLLSFYLLLLGFICLTIYLGVVTWNIQHSCQPMIGELDISICQPPPPPCPNPKLPICQPPPPPPPPPPPSGLGIDISDCLGAAAGAVTVTGLTILGSPIIAVVAAGVGVWWLVRTTIKAINGS